MNTSDHLSYLERRRRLRVAGLVCVVILVPVFLWQLSLISREEFLDHGSLSTLRRALRENPDDVELGIRLAHRLIKGQPDDIEEPYLIMSDLAKRRPNDPKVLFGLGRAAESCGRYSAAAEAFRRVTEIEPGNLQAINALAGIYGMAQLLPHAREQLERARALGEKSVSNADLWSRCMVYEERWDEAWEQLGELFLLNPSIQQPYENLPEIAIRTGQEKRAEELLQRRIRFSSQYSLLLVRAAYCRLLLHSREKSRIALARDEMERACALETGTGMPVYFVLLARARLMDSDAAAALDALGRAAALPFDAPVAHEAALLLEDTKLAGPTAQSLKRQFAPKARLQAEVLAAERMAKAPEAALDAKRKLVAALEKSGQIARAACVARDLMSEPGATESDRKSEAKLRMAALEAVDTDR